MKKLLMVFVLVVNVVTIASQQVANDTEPALPEPKNFKFEDQRDERQSYGLIRFEEQNRYQQFDDQNSIDNEGQGIKFEESRTENQRPKQQKKRRRRRPKQRFPNGAHNGSRYPVPGYPGPVYPGPVYPGPVYPGPSVYPGPQMFGPGPIYPGQTPYPSYPGPAYRPRPSATTALTAVTEALTSIAAYDDAQCVPRLLCEAAGGAGVPSAGATAGGWLQTISGLQPLLTLLAAYNGISSSPLFVFGRAVFLGMTSKANPGTCRYAYPQCPNEPEQLVHYLNNHNGGFFRFFAAPGLNQPQGLEQFYNQLSGQNFGAHQPQQSGYLQNNQNTQQGYGLQQNQQHLYNGQLQGQYQNQIPEQGYQNPLQQFGYGQQQPFNQDYNQRPSPHANGYGLYGQSYPYQQNLNQNGFKNNEIQKRIQNIRNTELVNNGNNKWSFPEDSATNDRDIYNNVRQGKVLKFPQSNVNSITAAEGFIFPGIQSNREYPIDSLESIDSNPYFEPKVVDDFRLYNQYNYGMYDGFNDDTSNSNGVRTVYIVRGHGDPNHPEIVHLASGQTL